MPFYLSTAWSESNQKDLRSTIEEFALNGIKYIELSGGSHYDEKIEHDLIELKEIYKLKYIVHNYFPPIKNDFVLNIASPDQEDRQRSINFVKRAITLASTLSSPLYTIHAGYVKKFNVTQEGYFKPDSTDKLDWGQAYANFYQSLEEILPFAEEHGVRIGIENLFPFSSTENYSLMCTQEYIKKLLETYIDNPYLGVLIDLGHLNVSANFLNFDRNQVFEDLIQKYRNKVFEIHISENDGSGDLHLPIQINSWQTKLIKKHKLFQVPLVIEGKNLSYKLIDELSKDMFG